MPNNESVKMILFILIQNIVHEFGSFYLTEALDVSGGFLVKSMLEVFLLPAPIRTFS